MDALPSSGPAAAVVLAAGASRRLHGYPKALLDVDGEPAVARIVRVARAGGLAPIVVVAGPHAPGIRRALDGAPATLVVHPGWARGRTGSLRAGLAAVPAARDLVVWPVDHPLVDAKSLDALTRARDRDPLAVWFLPMYLGRGGHPILLRRELRPALAELAADAPLRALRDRLGVQVRRIPVDDPAVVANLDDWPTFRERLDRWRAP